jgi:hypothetical protein
VHCIDGKSCKGSIKGLERISLRSAISGKLPKQTTSEQLNDSDNDSIVASMMSYSSKRQKTDMHAAVIEPDNIGVDTVRQL